MYGWLWRHLPGPAAVRVVTLVVAAFVVLAVCFLWVFPAVHLHAVQRDHSG